MKVYVSRHRLHCDKYLVWARINRLCYVVCHLRVKALRLNWRGQSGNCSVFLHKLTETKLFKGAHDEDCTLSSFINFSVCLFGLADRLTAARAREETGLVLPSSVVSISSLWNKGGCLMHDECAALICLVLLSQFELHKRKLLWRCQRRGIRISLSALSRGTSAQRHALEGDVLQCDANSAWGCSLLFTIYRISLWP